MEQRCVSCSQKYSQASMDGCVYVHFKNGVSCPFFKPMRDMSYQVAVTKEVVRKVGKYV